MRNLVNNISKLSPRELEVIEQIAWGAPKKEVAHTLSISVNTVAIHTAAIFKKTNCRSNTELSAAYFCHEYGIDINNSPRKEFAPHSFKPQIIAIALLCISIFGMISPSDHDQLVRLRHSTRAAKTSRARRKNDEQILRLN